MFVPLSLIGSSFLNFCIFPYFHDIWHILDPRQFYPSTHTEAETYVVLMDLAGTRRIGLINARLEITVGLIRKMEGKCEYSISNDVLLKKRIQ